MMLRDDDVCNIDNEKKKRGGSEKKGKKDSNSQIRKLTKTNKMMYINTLSK